MEGGRFSKQLNGAFKLVEDKQFPHKCSEYGRRGAQPAIRGNRFWVLVLIMNMSLLSVLEY